MKLGALIYRNRNKENLNQLHEENSYPLLFLIVISIFVEFVIMGNMDGTNLAWGQAGVYAKPWIAHGEEFDDNVFNDTTRRKSDIVTRFTPGLEVGYRSEPFTLLGRYDFDAEIFAKNTRLTQAQARQRGGMQLDYKPTRFWTLGFLGEYIETERPEDLNTTTGIAGERGRSRGYHFDPTFAYHFDALTMATSHYTFSRNERPQNLVLGGIGTAIDTRNDEHSTGLELARTFTGRDKGTISYGFRHFVVSGLPSDDLHRDTRDESSSHIVSLGWVRQLSSLLTLSLRGGPRMSSGGIAPEVKGSLSQRFQRGEVMVTYGRTQNIAVGRSGPIETESYLGTVSYQLLPHLTMRANPAYYVNNSENGATKVYRLDLTVAYAVNPWLFLQGSYGFSYERESGHASGFSSRGDRYRNVVFFELTVAPQYRLW
jgi:hypothetical protein